MKCKAAEIQKDTIIAQVMRTYGVWTLEVIEAECAELLLDSFPWFRGENRLNAFYEAQADVLEYWLNRNVADHVYVTDRRGRREATVAEAFEDTVRGTIWELRRELIAAGFEADALFDTSVGYEPEAPPLGSRSQNQQNARISWYAYNGRDAILTWIGSSALALHQMTYPGGKKRFSIRSLNEKLLFPLAGFMSQWLTEWFAGSDMADRRLKSSYREKLARLKRKYNVEMVPIDGAEKQEEEPLPPPPVDAFKYEILLRESMKTRF